MRSSRRLCDSYPNKYPAMGLTTADRKAAAMAAKAPFSQGLRRVKPINAVEDTSVAGMRPLFNSSGNGKRDAASKSDVSTM